MALRAASNAVGYLFRHYGGSIYEVRFIARSSENPSQHLVIYTSTAQSTVRETGEVLPIGTVWARPFEDFFGVLPDGTPRFQKINP